MNRFLETVRSLKRAPGVRQVCPSCGSLRIRVHDSLGGWLLPPTYSCEECGYVGKVILEVEEADLANKKR